jgi:hypothetical protein
LISAKLVLGHFFKSYRYKPIIILIKDPESIPNMGLRLGLGQNLHNKNIGKTFQGNSEFYLRHQ